MQIAKEAMEIKGLKTSQAKELLPQFLLDFQASGYFVYCGDGCWDLKDRQPTSVLDKDGTDFEIYSEEDEEVKKHELKDESYESDVRVEQSHDDDDEQDEILAGNDPYGYWTHMFMEEYETYEWLQEHIDDLEKDNELSKEVADELKSLIDSGNDARIVERCLEEGVL